MADLQYRVDFGNLRIEFLLVTHVYPDSVDAVLWYDNHSVRYGVPKNQVCASLEQAKELLVEYAKEQVRSAESALVLAQEGLVKVKRLVPNAFKGEPPVPYLDTETPVG